MLNNVISIAGNYVLENDTNFWAEQFTTFAVWAWDWFNAIAYWVACYSSIILLALYSPTKDKKYLNKVFVIFILYVFLKGLCSVL